MLCVLFAIYHFRPRSHHACEICKTVLSPKKRTPRFPFTLRRRNLKTHQSQVILDLSYIIIVIVFIMLSVHTIMQRLCFHLHLVWRGYSRNPAFKIRLVFSTSSGLKSVFEKLRFRDRLVWTVGLTVELNLRFQFLPSSVDRDSSLCCSRVITVNY